MKSNSKALVDLSAFWIIVKYKSVQNRFWPISEVFDPLCPSFSFKTSKNSFRGSNRYCCHLSVSKKKPQKPASTKVTLQRNPMNESITSPKNSSHLHVIPQPLTYRHFIRPYESFSSFLTLKHNIHHHILKYNNNKRLTHCFCVCVCLCVALCFCMVKQISRIILTKQPTFIF